MYFDNGEWRFQVSQRNMLFVGMTYRLGFRHKCGGRRSIVKAKQNTKFDPYEANWTRFNGNIYQRKFCTLCAKEIPLEMLEYFSKVMELWRLSEK